MNRPVEELTAEDTERMLTVGVDLAHKMDRSGTFIQIGQHTQSQESLREDVEVMDVATALKKHDWLKDYWWNAVKADKDEYTKAASQTEPAGYFVRALPGAKVSVPVQTCMYIKQPGETQKVHNVIIAEEGSELTVVTGCATSKVGQQGIHIGVSEFYVKKNARINFSMIHNWGPHVEVRPRSAYFVEQDGVIVNNFFCFRPVKLLEMYPSVYLAGEDSTATMNSVLVAHPESKLDVGARVRLQAAGARAESITRAVTTGGINIARGHLIGEVSGIRAHLECSGLILAENGAIHAIPELEGLADGVEMSHEAAVGRIAEDEVLYLMSRGLTREQATSAIVRGFLRIELSGLPEALKQQIDELTAKTAAESL